MMPDHSSNVFVSYSHSDASLVAPVVKLLRVNKSLVFQDTDDITPGKKWRDQIANALAKSDLVVVFWCHHANQSDEVSKEWKVAIEQDKDLMPLLLDGTPLPSELSEFQWIDFRDVVGANHSSGATPSACIPASAIPLPSGPPKKSARSSLWVSLVGIVAVIVIAVPLIYMTYQQPALEMSVPVEVNPPEPEYRWEEEGRREAIFRQLEEDTLRLEELYISLEEIYSYLEDGPPPLVISRDLENVSRNMEEITLRLADLSLRQADIAALEVEETEEAVETVEIEEIEEEYTDSQPAVPDASFEAPSSKLWFLGFVIAAMVFFVWLLRGRSMRNKEFESAPPPPPESPGSTAGELDSSMLDQTIERTVVIPHPTEIERHIATELESEILRRTASQRNGA